MDHIRFMQEALLEAKKAFDMNEVPIGCVVVRNEAIIARGFNLRNTHKNAILHAEMIAISKACEAIGDWRLDDCRLYVTVEPCPMCAGAIVQARLGHLIFGAKNPKAGCVGSILNLLNNPQFNHQVMVTENILADEAAQLMQKFFKNFRKQGSKEEIQLK